MAPYCCIWKDATGQRAHANHYDWILSELEDWEELDVFEYVVNNRLDDLDDPTELDILLELIQSVGTKTY